MKAPGGRVWPPGAFSFDVSSRILYTCVVAVTLHRSRLTADTRAGGPPQPKR